MKISVITVCYNSVSTIRTAIESVLAQRNVDFEYIVVDGGSKDGTIDIIKEYASRFGHSQQLKWISESDEGMYDAINKGIGLAIGDVVGILNADDLLESPNTLEHIAAGFEHSRDGKAVDCVYADVRFVKDDLTTTIRYYGAGYWRPWMHNWGYMPPHPSVYIRKENFERLGGYRLGYHISADFELMVRYLCRNKIRAAYLPESVVKMRLGGKSTKNWRANLLLNAENVRANRENGYFSCFAMMLPKYLFKIWGFVFRKQRG